MKPVTPEALKRIIRTIGPATAIDAAAALNKIMPRFGIETLQDQGSFIAQALHESLGFTRMVENLNYTADALRKIWPKRFTPEQAAMYGRIDSLGKPANQQMIANVAYANRMGNGSVESGDGWRFRGRGPGQLTGASNYRLCGKALGLDLAASPDQVAQLEIGLMAFAWFWQTNGLSELSNRGQYALVSQRVNGGDLGLQSRLDLTVATIKEIA
jgi:putative chitinase